MIEKEKSLLAGCLRGDKASWDAFVQQYSALVYHTIRKTLVSYHAEPSSELIDDLFQDFFVAIVRDDFKKLRQFRGEHGCTLASWVRLVAVRLTIDFLRKQDPGYAQVTENIRSDFPDLAENLASREQQASLLEAIRSLSPRDRLILQLSFHENLPPQDIAGILKMTVNAVYTQKSRILDRLRNSLKKNFSL